MKRENFKFIKGEYCEGQPADICFYTDVDYWSVSDFLWEFDYLVNWVRPSKIRIHINSVGGSVVEGMSVFAKIQNCNTPTECINDGLAASIGSIIWAAGDELYMKDYALLMIHNPFYDSENGKQYNQATEAFTQQLKTVYMKRFNISEDEVEAIMNGKEGEDGTFLNATQAVERGFVIESHIIETPKAVKDKIMAALNGSRDMLKIQSAFKSVLPTLPTATINIQNIKSNTTTMEENRISVFAALVGLAGEKATAENVSAKINELKAEAAKAEAVQKSLDETKTELVKVNAELTGARTSIKNLSDDLEKTKAALKTYQEAEAEAKDKMVNELIDKAIAECKINKEERDIYIKMAKSDFELAENVLAKIPGRDNIGEEISKVNKVEAKNNVKTEEQKIKELVDQVVGKDFKFRTL